MSNYQSLDSGLWVPSSAYEGASQSPRMPQAPTLDADSAVYSGIHRLRARAHHSVRNNPWAQSAAASWVAAAIGTGITPYWVLDDDALKRSVKALWVDWVAEADYQEQLDFYGLQALVLRTVINSGAAFVQKKPRKLSEGLAVPLQLQVIEPEMLCTDQDKTPIEKGGEIRGGIRFSASGKRQAYCFYKRHPSSAGFQASATHWIAAKDLLHVYRVDRPGQHQGTPWLASVLVRLTELDQYEDAELVRKKTSALFALFIEEAMPSGPSKILGSETQKKRKLPALEPGLFCRLGPGEKIASSSPADVGNTYEVWLRNQLLAISKGVGVSYEMLTGDLKNVNYSSIRAGLIEFRRLCEQVQRHLIIHQLCRGVGRWFMDFAVSSGALTLPDYQDHPRPYWPRGWKTPRWEEIDPLKKALADHKDLRSGLAGLEDKLQERGYEPDEALARMARFNARMDELGLVFDSDPRKTAANGAFQKLMDEAEQEESDDE